MSEPLNTIPIIQYLQQVKQADTSRSNEVRIPIDKAKALAYTLGMVMARLEGDLEKILIEKSSNDDVEIEVRLDGGSGF